jgi:hypothetical protein
MLPASPALFVLHFEQIDRREKVAQLAEAVVRDIEGPLVGEVGTDTAERGPAVLVLHRGDGVAQAVEELGVALEGIGGSRRRLGLGDLVEVAEAGAAIDEGQRRLLLAVTDDLLAAASGSAG